MHVMLDLETMGSGGNAAIIAIGAVAFDADGYWNEFYSQVSLKSSMDIGLDCDASTVMWWMQQSNEARSCFDGNDNAPPITSVLAEFSEWITSLPDGASSQVWGNGASFDNAILSNAYRKIGVEAPWKFWNDRCYRTIKALNQSVKFVRVGTYHNALDDAKSQAYHLASILWGDNR